jgi:hypothetical protein
LDWQKNSKTKVVKGVFLYFYVFLPGHEFFGAKKEKKRKIFATSFYQKLEPK